MQEPVQGGTTFMFQVNGRSIFAKGAHLSLRLGGAEPRVLWCRITQLADIAAFRQAIRNGLLAGANVIPVNVFHSKRTPEAMQALIQSALDNNANMLRLWGGVSACIRLVACALCSTNGQGVAHQIQPQDNVKGLYVPL